MVVGCGGQDKKYPILQGFNPEQMLDNVVIGVFCSSSVRTVVLAGVLFPVGEAMWS